MYYYIDGVMNRANDKKLLNMLLVRWLPNTLRIQG